MTSLLLTSAVLVSFCPESVSAGESVARSLNANSYASVVDNKQWNLGANSYGIDAESAWERNLHGEGIRIGLIDSGVYREHEELQGVSLEAGYNVIDSSTDTSDRYGHGTIVAGIIAADTSNHVGISGICDRATIVPIKCFDSSVTKVKNVVTGIYLAVDTYHCDVINLSLGVTADSPDLREAVEYAASKGVILVAAVGNNGETNPGQILYPAAYDSVVGVGAYDKNGRVSAFSHVNSSVFVTAPGEDLISLGNASPAEYRSVSGTSFAAAHVTALATIAKSVAPDLTVSEFQDLLRWSARDAGEPGYDTAYGYGMVSMSALLQELENPPLYSDIRDHWARTSIETCSEWGLLSGIGDGLFAPDRSVSRSMAVTVLWNLEGKPQPVSSSDFRDVNASDWYAQAVAWAAENGIVSGYGENRFGPSDLVTREQLASMLCSYAKYRGLDTAANDPVGYSDWNQISGYARSAMAWAVEHEIMRGKSVDHLVPRGTATRAELATMLCSFYSLINA